MLARTAFLLLPEAGFLECANVWDSRGKETYEECILRASTTHIHLECGLELHVKLGTRGRSGTKGQMCCHGYLSATLPRIHTCMRSDLRLLVAATSYCFQ